jgi:cytoskeleton protein RodZ
MSRRKRGRFVPPQQPIARGPVLDEAGAELVDQPSLDLHDPLAPGLPSVAEAAPGAPIMRVDAEAGPSVADSGTDKGVGEAASPVDFELVAPPPAAATPPLGQRFSGARIALGLTIEDTGRRLRVPAAVISDIEAQRFESLGAPIYARGYLRSYARLVAIPEAALAGVLATLPDVQPALQPALNAPAHRPLAPRLATPALYALLTLLLVAPVAVQFYQRSSAPGREPELQRLDAGNPDARPAAGADAAGSGSPAQTVSSVAGAQPEVSGEQDGLAAGTAPAVERQVPAHSNGATQVVHADSSSRTADAASSKEPVMASLAPMPASTDTPAITGQRVALHLAEASWVELIGADGSRIEYSMLPAGTAREYQVAGKASLRIGNTRGASLVIDGSPLDLAPFSHANVARVALGEGTPVPTPNL